MHVIVEPDEASVARTGAAIVAQIVSATPSAVLALPTGRTPLGLYRELISLHRKSNLDFSRIQVFNLDEYLGLSGSDPRSFHSYLREHFLSHVNIPANNIHLLSPIADERACRDYEANIRKAGGIYLLIAGVGTNGHIAFNEPGTPLDSRTRLVELAESTRDSMLAVFRPHERPSHAVTLGIGTILEARRILVLASGRTKQKAVETILQGPVTPESPVSAVRMHADTTVILDREAAEFGVRGA